MIGWRPAGLLGLFLLAGCGDAPRGDGRSAETGRAASDERAIRQAHDEMNSASASADWDRWAAAFAEDAVMMLPNGPSITGRDAILEHFSGWPPFGGGGVEIVELELSADIAYVRSRYRISMEIPGAGEVSDSGKSLAIWKRYPDGSWRIFRDMSSSDIPR
jgi:uncharacterized protein (TIGR02246 family)